MDAVVTGPGLDDPRSAPSRPMAMPRSSPHRADRIVSPVLAHLERLHARHASDHSGALASYIPELAKADPASFGICVATIGGAVYEVGDTRQPFTLQSISKPLTYGLALADHGERGRSGAHRRGTDRRRLQRHRPVTRLGHPVQPDGQRRRDRRGRARRRVRGPDGPRAHRRHVFGVGRPTAGRRRVGLSVRTRDRTSEPGDRPSPAQHRRPRWRSGRRRRPLLPPVLGHRGCPRPGAAWAPPSRPEDGIR